MSAAPPVAERPPAVVHVDLDGAADIYAAHGWSYKHEDDPLFESGLRATLDVLEAAGVRATLFVIGQAMEDPRRRALVQDAVKRGHQLASHTITHRWLPSLEREAQRREIADSRARLSDMFGVAVDGFRAPGFGTDAAILAFVAEAGYRYDSSLFGGPGAAAPYMLPGGLTELPLPPHRPLPLPFHASYSLVLGGWYFRAGLARHRRSGVPLVMLLHLTDLADPLPSHYLSGLKSRIFTLSYLSARTKRKRCEAMLAEVAASYRWALTDDLLAPREPREPARRDHIA